MRGNLTTERGDKMKKEYKVIRISKESYEWLRKHKGDQSLIRFLDDILIHKIADRKEQDDDSKEPTWKLDI
jgi:hypothetical protein